MTGADQGDAPGRASRPAPPRQSLDNAPRPTDRPLDRLFLRRSGYRQRRLRDALRLLPIAGAVLWTIPVFWTGSVSGGVKNGTALIYIFAIWLLLIVLSFVLSRNVRFADNAPAGDTDHDEPVPEPGGR